MRRMPRPSGGRDLYATQKDLHATKTRLTALTALGRGGSGGGSGILLDVAEAAYY